MKLYRIYRKEAFVTRLPLEETRIELPASGMIPAKIAIMPGVELEVCEMVAEGWAQRRVTIPEHEEIIESVIPEHTIFDHELVPGYWDTKTEYVQGHYETREIWIPEHEGEELVEIPGYYESRTVQEPGEWVVKTQWVEGHWETYLVTRPADPETGRLEVTYEDKRWVPGHDYQRKVWVEGRTRLVKFWVDATWEMQTVMIPGQYRDHRVWIEGDYKEVEVWVPDQMKPVTIVVPERIISTPVIVPERVERETYWKEAFEHCWMTRPEQTVIAGLPVTPEYLKALGDWFVWYQTTPAGQMFVDGAKTYGWLEDWSSQQVMQKAWELYRHFQPDVTVRVAPDVFMTMRPHELKAMLDSPQYAQYMRERGVWKPTYDLLHRMQAQGRTELTSEESAWLIKAGLVGVLVVGAGLLVYHTWPGAKFELTISYPEPVYVGRYMEVVTELDLVGVSPQGTPTFLRCTETGGPIMGETRTRDRDEWWFGEEWLWSTWVEEARWMGMGETRYWFSAEVEYLGMLSRSGARFYMLHAGRMDAARGGHEPGWTKSTQFWGTWEELEHHIRI